jgi:hypothetical protein
MEAVASWAAMLQPTKVAVAGPHQLEDFVS